MAGNDQPADAVEALRLPDRVIVDEHGHFWREYPDHYSMCPVSDENVEWGTAAVYVRVPDAALWQAFEEGRAAERGVAAAPQPHPRRIETACPGCGHDIDHTTACPEGCSLCPDPRSDAGEPRTEAGRGAVALMPGGLTPEGMRRLVVAIEREARSDAGRDAR